MSWPPPDDPRRGRGPRHEGPQPPVAEGPVEQPPWQASPPPIPQYSPPLPGQYGGYGQPQDTGLAAPPPPPTGRARYADWGERAAATLIDAGILFGVAMLVSVLTGFSEALESLAGFAWLGLAAYFAWLNGSKGQTPGKALTGVRLVRDSDGSTLGGAVGLVRGIVLLMLGGLTGGLFYVLSVLWPLWDARHQTLHDKIVGASAVGGQPRARLGKQVFLP